MKFKWSLLILTIVVTSFAFFDSTVIPVLVPTIEKSFSFDQIDVLWVVNSYLLALCSFLVISGRLHDIFGVRKIYITGMLILGIGSLCTACAAALPWLLLGRALQGIGIALCLPCTGIIIMEFPQHQRGKAVGLSTGISALFLISGSLVGGFLAEYGSWRLLFISYIPVALIGMYAGYKLIKQHKQKQGKFHLLNALVIMLAVIALVIALMQGDEWGWSSWISMTLFTLALFLVLVALYIFRHNHDPVLNLKLFRIAQFRTHATLLFLIHFIVMIAVLWALFFQEELAFSPVQTGMLMVVATIPVFVIAPLSGWCSDRFGPKIPIVTGFVLTTLSLVWFSFFMKSTPLWLLVGLAPFGCGVPLVMSPALAKALEHVPSSVLGAASSLLAIIRQLASTLSVAVLSALFHAVHSHSSRIHAFFTISISCAVVAVVGTVLALYAVESKSK